MFCLSKEIYSGLETGNLVKFTNLCTSTFCNRSFRSEYTTRLST